ncbi:trehalose-phosphatase [Sphingobium sp. SCG-1]|nr:trehalose-phosphatase [Sphingobium sp. SCG-1]
MTLLDGATLFLDFDGTLVPLTDEPDSVVVDNELRVLLADLAEALSGRLAIVSGRSVETLRDRFGLGGFILSGSHGLEFAHPGEPTRAPTRQHEVDIAEAELEAFIADKPGLRVERKTLSVGLHFRKAPGFADACRTIAEALAQETGLYLQAGKMVYELRPGGADKGTAIRLLMQELPLSTGLPLFFGDDVTDEDGFAAAAGLGGNGVLVGPDRRTDAQWHLEHVDAVRHYLSTSVAHLCGKVALTSS